MHFCNVLEMYLQLEIVRMVVFSLQIMFIATPLLAFFFMYFLARIRSTFQSYLPKNSWMIMHKKHFALTEISCFCMMEIASRLLLFWVCARMNVLICFYNICWMCLFSSYMDLFKHFQSCLSCLLGQRILPGSLSALYSSLETGDHP